MVLILRTKWPSATKISVVLFLSHVCWQMPQSAILLVNLFPAMLPETPIRLNLVTWRRQCKTTLVTYHPSPDESQQLCCRFILGLSKGPSTSQSKWDLLPTPSGLVLSGGLLCRCQELLVMSPALKCVLPKQWLIHCLVFPGSQCVKRIPAVNAEWALWSQPCIDFSIYCSK